MHRSDHRGPPGGVCAAVRWRPGILVTLLLGATGGAYLDAAGLAAAQERPPHVPTEEELRQRLGGAREEPARDYQRESVRSWGQKAQQGATWVKERLSSLHVTPARLLLGLGILGLLYTWNKNKNKVPWAVLTGFAVLLLILGAAAMVWRWPYLN